MLKRNIARLGVLAGAAALVTAGTLGTANASTSAPSLSLGSSGTGVWCVQHDINDILHLGLSEDGHFGPSTQAAVKTFQANWGLPQDGVVGPQTGNYLFYYGDSYYNGTSNGYCYPYLPMTW